METNTGAKCNRGVWVMREKERENWVEKEKEVGF